MHSMSATLYVAIAASVGVTLGDGARHHACNLNLCSTCATSCKGLLVF